MLKNLLATTAIVAISTLGAQAANTKTDSLVTSPRYVASVQKGATLGSKLIGQDVYSSQTQGSQSIGQIKDLVIGPNGSLRAVVIGVGGFLGMGEKNVAIPYSSLKWTTRTGETMPVAVLATTKQELQGAPTFDMAALKNSKGGTMPGASDATAGKGIAAAADGTMTPIVPSTISATNLTGRTVYSADNRNIGEVGDVLLTKEGKIAAVVLDVGGFLGIGEKPVAIAFDDLKIMSDANKNLYLHTAFTKTQLEAAPTFDRRSYADNPDSVILQSKG